MSEPLAVKSQPSVVRRVLVVDDDKSLRGYARLALHEAGFEALEASSGEQALAIVERERVDAILLDIRMPGMDGLEACRRIRNMSRGAGLPIIMATGLNDDEAVDTAYQAGATDFVVKPINWSILRRRIHFTIRACNTREALHASKGQRDALLSAIPDAVLSLDEQGRVTEARLPGKGWTAGEQLFSIGRVLAEALPSPADELARVALQSIIDGANQAEFAFSVRTSGGERDYEVYLAPGGESAIVALVHDLTGRRRAEAEIHRLAYYDKVTGLPNQERMCQLIQAHVRAQGGRETGLALLRLEIVGLENARALLGRQRAEELVNMYAIRLRGLIEGDEVEMPASLFAPLVGRVGDAGFAVARDDFQKEGHLQRFAHEVQDRISGNYLFDDYDIDIATRVGVASIATRSADRVEEVFDRAEVALSMANTEPCVYSVGTGQKRREQAFLHKELQTAVQNGDLHLAYQPKVDSLSGELLGVEALARWDHPTLGYVPPGMFIPLAEESGLILSIGELVLEKACEQSRSWRQAGCSVVPIAVNFSGHQFSQHGLIEHVISRMNTHGIGEGEIEIELTETVAMEHSNEVNRILQQLNDIGIRIAIDDFGTGYSSLNNLRQFQFHTLKIDRSFVSDLAHNPSARSIIQGIIGMGHALGMQIVAEGVEEEHQLDYLREQGCDLIQGYLTGRPASGVDIQGMLRAA